MPIKGGILGYQPMPKQSAFHNSRARTRLYLGGNGAGKCCTYETLVETTSGKRPMGELFEEGRPFEVWAWDGERPVRARASAPFRKDGLHECYRLTMVDGQWVEVADEHRLLTGDGWRYVSDLLPLLSLCDLETYFEQRGFSESWSGIPLIESMVSLVSGYLLGFFASHPESTLGISLSAHGRDAGRWSGSVAGCQDDCSGGFHRCGGRLLMAGDIGPTFFPSLIGALLHDFAWCGEGDLGSRCTSTGQREFFLHSILDDLRRFAGRFVEFSDEIGGTISRLFRAQRQEPSQLSTVELSGPRSGFGADQSLRPSTSSSSRPLACSPPVVLNGNRIISCNPIGLHEVYDFEVSEHHNYLAGDLIHHNTACGAAELVMVATGTHPVRSVPDRMSGIVNVPRENAVCWMVGLDYGLLRDVEWRAVFELMPPEFIESFDRLNHVMKLKNGTVIHGKSADAGRDKFQGAAVNACWIDEEPDDAVIMKEILARTFRCRGDVWITATPLKGFSKLLYEDIYRPWEAGDVRCDKWGVPDIDVIQSFSSENVHLDPEEIARSARAFSEEERLARLFGMFSQPSGRVFPEFQPSLHVVPRQAMGELRAEWPTVIGMDVGAGQGHTAAYLMTLREDGVVLVLKEYYQDSGCPLTQHVVGLRLLAGVGSEGGMGKMPMVHLDRTARQFAIDLAAHGIPVAKSKSDHMSGFSRIREAMAGDDEDTVGLLIAAECRHLIQDLPRYAWKEPIAGEDGRDKVRKRSDHSIDAFRYGLMALPRKAVLKRKAVFPSISERVAARYKALIQAQSGKLKLRDSYGVDGLG